MRKSAYGLGIGIGLFVLQFLIAPFLGDHEVANKTLGAFVTSLLVYGGVNVLTFIVRRDWLGRVDMALVWIIIPAILLKLIMDII